MQARAPGHSRAAKENEESHMSSCLAYASLPLNQTCQIKWLPNSLSLGLSTINRASALLIARGASVVPRATPARPRFITITTLPSAQDANMFALKLQVLKV